MVMIRKGLGLKSQILPLCICPALMNVGLDPDSLTLLCKALLWGFQTSISKHSTGQNSPHFFSSFVPETLHQGTVSIVEHQHAVNEHRTSQCCNFSNDNESFPEVCWCTPKFWGSIPRAEPFLPDQHSWKCFTAWKKDISVSLLLRLPLASFLPDSSCYPLSTHTF